MHKVLRFLSICSLAMVFFLAGGGVMRARSADADYDALRRFSQVLDMVEQYYVKDVEQKELIDGALKGMLQGLDPHSTLLSTKEFQEMQESTNGEFFGVGVEITMENGQVLVVAPIEDTPGYRAGLRSGDIIVAVDGQYTMEMSLSEASSKMRGKRGTTAVAHRAGDGGGTCGNVAGGKNAGPGRALAVIHLDPLAANIGRKQGIEGGFIIKIVPVGLIVHAADNIIGDTAGNDGAPLRIVQIVHGGDFIIHVARVVAQRAAQHILHQPGAAFAGFFMQHIGGLAHFFPVHFHGALDRVAQFAHCQGTFFQSLRIAYTLKRNSVTSPSCIT